METNAKDLRHFVTRASNIDEASCFGRYMGMSVEKVLINVPVTGNFHDQSRRANFTLIRVLLANLWDHRIDVSPHDVKLIDTEGLQHDQEMNDLYIYQENTEVRISAKKNMPYTFTSHARTLEGKAKTRGWFWFPALPQEIYPHRLILNFLVFAPGYTSGAGEDHETLEVEFVFKFSQLLPESKKFVTLEVEKAK